MNRLFTLLFLLIPTFIFSQNSFSSGYQEGYKAGYCYEQGYSCISPIPPITPIQRIGESTYADGYNRGFSDGKNSRSSTNSNSSSSGSNSTISTSTYSPMSMEEMLILAKARQQSGGYSNNSQSETSLIEQIITLPYELLVKWDEFSISPAYAFSKPNNELYKQGYGINLDGRFGDNRADLVYGYSYIQYTNIEDKENILKQHTINFGVALNLLNKNNVLLEITPLLEYELNNKKGFGYGGYLGFKKNLNINNLSIGSRYKYTTVSNQISVNLIYLMN